MPIAVMPGEQKKTKKSTLNKGLSEGTKKVICAIENETIRRQLLHGFSPADVVDGWYYALALEIVKDQRKRNDGSKETGI